MTAAPRAHLHDRLQRALGEEAAQTMMAYLPEDGVASKGDVARLEALIGRCATKDDLERFATKEQHRELRGDVHRLMSEVHDVRTDVAQALVQGERLRAEWREDLLTYVGRQTLVQIGSILTIIIAALVFATQFNG